MKLTKTRLKQIIREEIQNLNEANYKSILKKYEKNSYNLWAERAYFIGGVFRLEYRDANERSFGYEKLRKLGIKDDDILFQKINKENPYRMEVIIN